MPEVNHRAIAGLWKLTQKIKKPSPATFSLKEFTVFPKNKELQKKNPAMDEEENEMLLMLKEDGSFLQYSDEDKPDEEVNIPDKLRYHEADDAVLDRFFGKIQGKWEFLDGNLILAADRPVQDPNTKDTLLVGEVVATSGESLQDTPSLKQEEEESTHLTTSSSAVDTHLSVPKGQVNVGKFIYPPKHPSFFEQPMFEPTPKGKFELKQVLGSLNAQTIKQEEELVEKFRQKDFYEKRFLLTFHEISDRRPKGNTRWSIKYSKFVGKLILWNQF